MSRNLAVWFVLMTCFAPAALADPCGMVPPIYPGEDVLITRVGEQRTYVFYKDGVETFLIKPGFSGKIDEFGMLIPFPTPPAIRKVPDNIFEQITAAIDPPEVVVDLRPQVLEFAATAGAARKTAAVPDTSEALRFNEVRVIKQEAIGMYEVTTLEAGSSAALKRWMDDHGYKYPTGMDKVCDEYVAQGWCFVAVKTQVGQKKGVDPQPGQREVNPKLPAGATFDGHVQAMGFRFQAKEFEVPMRLSAFNAGELHNIVYLLTDGPRRIDSMPESLVVRQLGGAALHYNVTQPLPMRIIGGTEDDIPKERLPAIARQRDPTPHNGLAKELFASDLLAVSSGNLALAHEEKEKELLRIGERLDLRGPEIDKLNGDALLAERVEISRQAIDGLKGMTMTVVDGPFDREALGRDELRFVSFELPAARNTAAVYDARMKAPAGEKEGIVVGAAPAAMALGTGSSPGGGEGNGGGALWWIVGIAAAVVVVGGGLYFAYRRK